MCGEFHPSAIEDRSRFTLTVDGSQIPVFLGKYSNAEYPEIRVFPFVDEDHKYYGSVRELENGNALAGEYPDIIYRRSRTDTTVRKIRSVIEIYGTTLQEVFRIRDALVERIERFRLAEAAYFVDSDGWEQDGNVYINAKYDSDLGIFRIYDLDTKLTRTENVEDTNGSWDITDDGLIINPITQISNLKIGQIYNGGYHFYDGSLMQSRGIMSLRIVRSNEARDERGRPEIEENAPDIPKWTLHLIAKYKDVMSFKVGEPYSGAIVNG